MTTPTIPTIKRVFIEGFDKADCVCCQRPTFFKLADYVSHPSRGGFYSGFTPICKKCHKRITGAAAKAVKGGAR